MEAKRRKPILDYSAARTVMDVRAAGQINQASYATAYGAVEDLFRGLAPETPAVVPANVQS